MSDLSQRTAEPRARAAQSLQRGQALEAHATAESVAEAIRCYDQAVAQLHPLQAEPHCRVDLAIAWMNRGNALQRLRRADSVAASVTAYDEAISLLRSLPVEADPGLRNVLGAAWMNRGHACQQQPTPEAQADAVRCHREALVWLQSLPHDQHPAFARNLAGARVNLATALLEQGVPDTFGEARETALAALPLVEPAEKDDPGAADLSLKARRAWCVALGQLSVLPAANGAPANWIAEASDAVDDGLALVRHWEAKGARFFRGLAVRLYHFGAQLYLRHQPQFLAEFLLESIDPDVAAGAMPDEPDLYAIAGEALGRAREQFGRVGRFTFGTPEADRELAIWRDLQAAESRLAALHQHYSAAAPAVAGANSPDATEQA